LTIEKQMKQGFLKRIVIVVFFFLTHLVSAQNVYELTNQKQPERIGSKFRYLLDETNSLTIDNVLKSNNFISTTDEVPNFNITKATVWGTIRITTQQELDWCLSLEPATFNKVTVYQRIGKRSWTEKSEGNIIPIESKSAAVNHFVFKLDIHPGDTIQVAFKLQEYWPILIEWQAGTLTSFLAPYHEIDIFYCFCLGIIAMMFLYNLYLFISQREKAYMFYVGYILFSMIFLGYIDGYSLHFPAFLFNTLQNCPVLPPCVLSTFLLLFTMELFKGTLGAGIKKTMYAFISVVAFTLILSLSGFIASHFRFGTCNYLHYSRNNCFQKRT
jgi:hypothetical protein